MSHPILYDKRATDFWSLGLGILTDAISCIVTEARNGVFELEMVYPITGAHYEKIKTDRIIKVDAGHEKRSKNQCFRIKRIDKVIDGQINVYAQHVSYLSQELPISPRFNVSRRSATDALSVWRDAIAGDHPFETFSDIMTLNSTHLTIGDYQNPRQILGGIQGSILDVWGGEYAFDNYHISLLNRRGGDANTLISYGRNLTDLSQEENISNTFTSVYPYAIFRNGDKDEIVTLASPYVVDHIDVNKFPNRRVLPVDFSNEFERDIKPTPKALEALAKAFIADEANGIGKPRVSISLSFVDLTKSLNQAGLVYEQVNLCDRVPVYFEKLDINTTAQVTRIEWNVLLDQYERLEIGDIRPTLGDTIRNIEREVNEVAHHTNTALTAANGRNTVFFGHFENPSEPIANRVGDLWYRPNGEETEMWMWNGSAWAFITSTAPDQRLMSKISTAQETADRAVNDANASMNRANEVFNNIDPLVRFTDPITGNKTTVKALAQGLQSAVFSGDGESQITQLSDQINLRVKDLEENIISQINITPEDILIQGNRIHLTGDTFIDRAVITDALFKDLQAGRIETTELIAGIADVIQLNANRITTGTLNANLIQAGTITGDHIIGRAINADHLQAGIIDVDHLRAGLITGLINEHDISEQLRSLMVDFGDHIRDFSELVNAEFDGSLTDLERYLLNRIREESASIRVERDNILMSTRAASGNNLLRNSVFIEGFTHWLQGATRPSISSVVSNEVGANTAAHLITGSRLSQHVDLVPDRVYTLSFRNSVVSNGSLRTSLRIGANETLPGLTVTFESGDRVLRHLTFRAPSGDLSVSWRSDSGVHQVNRIMLTEGAPSNVIWYAENGSNADEGISSRFAVSSAFTYTLTGNFNRNNWRFYNEHGELLREETAISARPPSGATHGTIEFSNTAIRDGFVQVIQGTEPEVPSWSPHALELYTNNMRLDDDGLRVFLRDGHGTITQETVMRHNEFAGYSINGNNRERVFVMGRNSFDMSNANVTGNMNAAQIIVGERARLREPVLNIGNNKIVRLEDGIGFF